MCIHTTNQYIPITCRAQGTPTQFQSLTMMEVDQPTEAGAGINRGSGGTLTAEASRLFRVYKTISSMLSKRGYMVSREMREMSPTDFTERFGEYPSREGLTILVVSSDGPKYYRQIQMMSKTLLICPWGDMRYANSMRNCDCEHISIGRYHPEYQ